MLEFVITDLRHIFCGDRPTRHSPDLHGFDRKEERRDPAANCSSCRHSRWPVILIVFAFAGDTVFRFLGISLPAFRIAGGLLLLLLSMT